MVFAMGIFFFQNKSPPIKNRKITNQRYNKKDQPGVAHSSVDLKDNAPGQGYTPATSRVKNK
jgi:hypothetical protein